MNLNEKIKEINPTHDDSDTQKIFNLYTPSKIKKKYKFRSSISTYSNYLPNKSQTSKNSYS